MTTTVMIVVTHLLGTGHLARALTLGRAFASQGHDIHVVSGGFPVPHLSDAGLTLHQLPPLRANGTDFSTLLGENGEAFSAEDHIERQARLVGWLNEIAPDILITELFPFGRRNLRAEFTGLLDAAPPQTRVFCSIRDVLAPPSKPAKAEFAERLVQDHYDAVLVHSDPTLLPLSRSWPVPESMEPLLRYTGFVSPPPPEVTPGGKHAEILVSAGGGAVGDHLFETALEAANDHSHHWRILLGADVAQIHMDALQSRAPENVTIERARPDFRMLMTQAAGSVSMCGYNTAMDILQTCVPAVVVPFDAGNETEQSVRADALGNLDGIQVVSDCDLTPQTLLAALAQSMSAPSRNVDPISFDGALETVRICEGFLG